MNDIDLSIRRMLELLADIRERMRSLPVADTSGKPAIRILLGAMSPKQWGLYVVLDIDRYASR